MTSVRSDLPTGTITFLFTDIEGSTKLLHKLGAEGYADALGEHRALLRDAFARHGGVEVDTQGDAFFVAFPSAPNATTAAFEVQAGLAATPVRVRIGLHTGTPLVTAEGYVGPDVHRAARVAAAGHGGQVLLTSATAALLGKHDAGMALHDLGVHRLKDLSSPERIYQLSDVEFPPLRTLYQTNLPIPLTPFLGRATEVAGVVDMAGRPDVRLLTLTGPGGTGKTRLAQQCAAELGDGFPGGVWWVPLASLRDPGLVIDTAARVVGSRDGLADHIGGSSTLLVFDNFEQVIDAAPDVSSVLVACPNLRVLVTSREALHVAGEHEYPVPPLTLTDAAELFTARATAADPAFVDDGAVHEICRRLDELPLAIELAAARVKVLSPSQILARLEGRLALLTGGARDLPERQRTLRATIEWSYDLLTDEERRLFARMAVFRGGCTLDAAEAVTEAGLDNLQSLVDKSLVRHRDNRFAMLELIREYAAERLEASADAEQTRRQHATFFMGMARTAEPHLQSDEIEWVERLAAEQDNLRAVLDLFEADADWQSVLELAGRLHRFWYLHSHFGEGLRRLEGALAADEHPTPARAMALRAASVMALNLGDPGAAHKYAEESLVLYRQLGDRWSEAYMLMMMGNAAGEANELPEALRYLEQSAALFEELGDDRYTVLALSNVSWVAGALGDPVRDRQINEEILRRARAAGYERMIAGALAALASFARQDGRLDEARAMCAEAISIEHRRGDVHELATDLGRMAAIVVRAGEPETAAELLGYSDAVFDGLGATRAWWDLELKVGTIELLRAALDPAGLTAAIDAGRAMTQDEIVALAVGDPANEAGSA
jgi:predicted ATPase/class 3 adenylate cyclase